MVTHGSSPHTAPLVAVVHHDLTERGVLVEALRKEGLEPLALSGAEDALNAFRQRPPPALIVTDLHLPGIDGWQFCRLLRSPDSGGLSTVPILMVSAALSGEDTSAIASDLGVDAFVTAPVEEAVFRREARALLAGRRGAAPDRALVAEDDPEVAGRLKEALEGEGYQVRLVSDASQARTLLARESFKVATLAFHLPDEPGDTLLEEIRERHPGCVVLMMTRDARPELALEWMRKGAAAFLRKPFSTEYLLELLARARRERALLRGEAILEERTRRLRASEEQFRRLAESAPAVLFQFRMGSDGSFSVPYISERVETLSGVPAEAIMADAEALFALLHPEAVPSFRQAVLESAHRLEPFQMELRGRRKSGDEVWVDARSTPEGRPDGSVLWNGFLTDVTERRRAEEALRKSEERYQSFVSQSSEGIYRMELKRPIPVDLPVEEQVDLLYDLAWLAEYNHRFAEMYQAESPEDLRGLTLLDFHGGRHDEKNRQEVRNFIQSGYRIEDGETTETTVNGVERHFLNSTVGIVESGRLVRIWGTQADVTERKSAEEALRRVSERQDTLLRGIPDIVMEVDRNKVYTWANPAGYEFFGDDVIGKPADAFFVGEQDTYAEVDPLFRGRDDLFYVESFQRRKDGEVRLLAWWAQSLKDEEGRVVGALSTARDITDQRRVEEALRESEARWQFALEGAGDGVWDWNAETNEVFFSPQWKAMLGYTEEEIGNTLSEWETRVHPDDREAVLAHLRAHLAEESEAFSAEYRMRCRDGNYKWILDRGKVLTRRPDGAPLRVIGTHTDIADRKRAESEIREAHQLFQEVVEGAQEGIIVYGPDLRYRVFNPFMEHLSGKPASHVLGRLPEEVFPFLAELPFRERLEAALAGEAGETMDFPFSVPETGRSGWVSDTTSPLRDADGEIVGVIAVVRDVTKRKEMEEERAQLQAQLLQSQKMESVGRLAGGVAHDFNNMLSVVLGHSELALDRLTPGDPLYSDLLEIRKAGERSADLTRQLLAFARLQTVDPRIIDLNDTAAGMLKMLQRLIGEDVDLVWIPGPSLWPVRMDAAQIDQVLANLCVNARDAIEGVGRITIETGNVTLDEASCAGRPGFRPGEFVRLSVSDDGCGMDEHTMDHIFEPFFTTKGMGQGTGLGLATVYGIVKQNDGIISVRSEPDGGSTFEIYLPRAARGPGQGGSSPDDEEIPGAHGETILLVEDEPALLQVGRAMMRQLGYTVLTAGSPGAALQVAEQHDGDIHLLLTDVIMPEMDGRELAAHLTGLRPGLKCLFVSGYTADVIGHHGVLDPGVHFMQKPFSLRDMATKIRETLDAG